LRSGDKSFGSDVVNSGDGQDRGITAGGRRDGDIRVDPHQQSVEATSRKQQIDATDRCNGCLNNSLVWTDLKSERGRMRAHATAATSSHGRTNNPTITDAIFGRFLPSPAVPVSRGGAVTADRQHTVPRPCIRVDLLRRRAFSIHKYTLHRPSSREFREYIYKAWSARCPPRVPTHRCYRDSHGTGVWMASEALTFICTDQSP